MPLKIDGRKFAPVGIPPMVRKAIEFLGRLPDDQGMSTRNLSRAIGHPSIRHYTLDPELQPYTMLVGQKRIWANPRTIRRHKHEAKT